MDIKGCPLYKTLKEMGFQDFCVGGSDVIFHTSRAHYQFNISIWNHRKMKWAASRHRSITLEILGLEPMRRANWTTIKSIRRKNVP